MVPRAKNTAYRVFNIRTVPPEAFHPRSALRHKRNSTAARGSRFRQFSADEARERKNATKGADRQEVKCTTVVRSPITRRQGMAVHMKIDRSRSKALRRIAKPCVPSLKVTKSFDYLSRKHAVSCAQMDVSAFASTAYKTC